MFTGLRKSSATGILAFAIFLCSPADLTVAQSSDNGKAEQPAQIDPQAMPSLMPHEKKSAVKSLCTPSCSAACPNGLKRG